MRFLVFGIYKPLITATAVPYQKVFLTEAGHSSKGAWTRRNGWRLDSYRLLSEFKFQISIIILQTSRLSLPPILTLWGFCLVEWFWDDAKLCLLAYSLNPVPTEHFHTVYPHSHKVSHFVTTGKKYWLLRFGKNDLYNNILFFFSLDKKCYFTGTVIDWCCSSPFSAPRQKITHTERTRKSSNTL